MSVDLVRIIDSIHRDKNIPKEVLWEGIQSALLTAAKKHFPEAEEITVTINQEDGSIDAIKDGERMNPEFLGRIAAQTAKQVIIQKFREAERDSLYDEFENQKGDLITGTVQRFEGGAVTVNLGKTEALLPRSEQIPGESHHPNERIRAVILDVRKAGPRVKIILSRTHQEFVRRLFELEIPEIADQIITIRALAREAGYRSKVAVSSIDAKVDAVGACVGVRGTRIKNIVDELGGERIDIVRWNESLQVLIPNALQPAEIDEVMLCQLLGRAIVLVREDQLSLAIGRRGQNVRLASKLVGWDIEIMTSEELDELIEKAVGTFTKIEGVDNELAEKLVEQGILSFDDLSVMEITDLVNTVDGLTEELAIEIRDQAEILAEEQVEEMPRRKGARPAPAAEQDPSIGEEDGERSTDGASETEAGDAEGGEAEAVEVPTDQAGSTRPTLDEMFGDGGEADGDGVALESPEATEALEENSSEENLGDGENHDDAEADFRDVALAEETSGRSQGSNGHEVTSPPSDADQEETNRIVTEAMEPGYSPRKSKSAAGTAARKADRKSPTPKEPSETTPVEERDSEMQQP